MYKRQKFDHTVDLLSHFSVHVEHQLSISHYISRFMLPRCFSICKCADSAIRTGCFFRDLPSPPIDCLAVPGEERVHRFKTKLPQMPKRSVYVNSLFLCRTYLCMLNRRLNEKCMLNSFFGSKNTVGISLLRRTLKYVQFFYIDNRRVIST